MCLFSASAWDTVEITRRIPPRTIKMESPISIKEKTGTLITSSRLSASYEIILLNGPDVYHPNGDFNAMCAIVGSSVIEESLLSMEELDRASPELWPEQIPGESEYYASTTSFGKGQSWMKGLDSDDKAFLIYLSKLTPTGLVSEVKKLYDTAYQLGCEESKEMTRGKYLKGGGSEDLCVKTAI